MIFVYTRLLCILSAAWLIAILIGVLERETSHQAALLTLPYTVHMLKEYHANYYTPLKVVVCNVLELTYFVLFQVFILYIVSPFEQDDSNLHILLFLCGVCELALFPIHDRFNHRTLVLLWFCGSITIVYSVLCGSDVITFDRTIVIPSLIYSTYVANTITFTEEENLEELQHLIVEETADAKSRPDQ